MFKLERARVEGGQWGAAEGALNKFSLLPACIDRSSIVTIIHVPIVCRNEETVFVSRINKVLNSSRCRPMSAVLSGGEIFISEICLCCSPITAGLLGVFHLGGPVDFAIGEQ